MVDDLSKAKVDDLDVSLRVEDQVFQLYVAIYDAQRVQMGDRRGDAGGIEACLVKRKGTRLVKRKEPLP